VLKPWKLNNYNNPIYHLKEGGIKHELRYKCKTMAKDMQIKLTKEQKRVCKIDEFLEEVKSSLQKKDVLL